MENLYTEFEDIAVFRFIYIGEAHPADSSSPVSYAEEKGIMTHKDYDDRCSVCRSFIDDEGLTIPAVVDTFDNATNRAYLGFPARVFLVRKDGTLGIAGEKGPEGVRPALTAVREWLTEYRDTGVER